jgi:hypothetical protein
MAAPKTREARTLPVRASLSFPIPGIGHGLEKSLNHTIPRTIAAMNPNDRTAIRTFSLKDRLIVASFADFGAGGARCDPRKQKNRRRSTRNTSEKTFCDAPIVRDLMFNYGVFVSFNSNATVMLS